MAKMSKAIAKERPEGSKDEDGLLVKMAELMGIHLPSCLDEDGFSVPDQRVLDGNLVIEYVFCCLASELCDAIELMLSCACEIRTACSCQHWCCNIVDGLLSC